MVYKCLSIAGFDGSGGAGIQADLKTFSALGCYGMNVLTVLPVQNTCGVRACYPISAECVQSQMQAIFDDIMPDAIKIGALFSRENILCIADFLSKHAKHIPIVLDPVMVATSGDSLLKINTISTLKQNLIPLATLITPNLPEAKTLIPHVEDKTELAHQLLALGCQAVLLKGGHEVSDPFIDRERHILRISGEKTFKICSHMPSMLRYFKRFFSRNSSKSNLPKETDLLQEAHTKTCDDLFLTANTQTVLSAQRIDSRNTHGTGCTLSAAITSFLAQGMSLLPACQAAKMYLSGAIAAAKDWQIGRGHGPVDHFYREVRNHCVDRKRHILRI